MNVNNDKHVFFWVVNYAILGLYMVSLPLHYRLDYLVMHPIYLSCGCYLAMSLLIYIFYRNLAHLLLTTFVFILHALLAG